MRFPQKEGKIDLEETQKLVDACVAGGINYFDTAYVYGDGDSENAVRRTLVERYPREQFHVADKLPIWMLPNGHTPEELMETSLQRLGVDYFDLYLLHNLNKEHWEICQQKKLIPFLFAQKEKGVVRHAGFSFHDTPELLEEILKAADWDFVQLQINYYDWETAQRAREQYELVAARGIPCIIMEPVRGGRTRTPYPCCKARRRMPAPPLGRCGLRAACPARPVCSAACPLWSRWRKTCGCLAVFSPSLRLRRARCSRQSPFWRAFRSSPAPAATIARTAQRQYASPMPLTHTIAASALISCLN